MSLSSEAGALCRSAFSGAVAGLIQRTALTPTFLTACVLEWALRWSCKLAMAAERYKEGNEGRRLRAVGRFNHQGKECIQLAGEEDSIDLMCFSKERSRKKKDEDASR